MDIVIGEMQVMLLDPDPEEAEETKTQAPTVKDASTREQSSESRLTEEQIAADRLAHARSRANEVSARVARVHGTADSFAATAREALTSLAEEAERAEAELDAARMSSTQAAERRARRQALEDREGRTRAAAVDGRKQAMRVIDRIAPLVVELAALCKELIPIATNAVADRGEAFNARLALRDLEGRPRDWPALPHVEQDTLREELWNKIEAATPVHPRELMGAIRRVLG